MLNILEPMTLPKAKSLSPLVAAITDVTNSGREVPIETIVRPISWSLIPKLLAISDAEFTTKFPPNIIAAIPIIFGAISSLPSSVRVGGTSLLIVVGVALETYKQLDSELITRSHTRGRRR